MAGPQVRLARLGDEVAVEGEGEDVESNGVAHFRRRHRLPVRVAGVAGVGVGVWGDGHGAGDVAWGGKDCVEEVLLREYGAVRNGVDARARARKAVWAGRFQPLRSRPAMIGGGKEEFWSTSMMRSMSVHARIEAPSLPALRPYR